MSFKKVSTNEFANQVILRLGQLPNKLSKSKLACGSGKIVIPDYVRPEAKKELLGVDVFIDWKGENPEEIGAMLDSVNSFKLKLKMITKRGVKVYPKGLKETYCTDHWRCRFVASNAQINSASPIYESVEYEQIIALLSKLHNKGFDIIKTENLYEFDGKRAFSLGQGE